VKIDLYRPACPDSFEANVIGRLAGLEVELSEFSLNEVIDCCEFVGRLLHNPRSHQFPAFSGLDWGNGFAALRRGRDWFRADVEAWLKRNYRADGLPIRLGRLLGWASEILVDSEGVSTSGYDHLESPLGVQISNTIRAACDGLLTGDGAPT
jgi:hypothetical protein